MQASRSGSTAQQQSTMPKNDQKYCPLFKLPPELRNRIYSYATSQSEAKEKPRESELPLDKSNQLTYHDYPFNDRKDHHSLPVVSLNQLSDVKPSNALLGTCQRIHEEAGAMFAASQRAFRKTNAFLFDLDDDNNCVDDVSTTQKLVARLHPRQIDSMPKFTVVITIDDCLHTFHFTEDDKEMTDDDLNEGYVPNCGFWNGGCSHTGAFSRAELRQRCADLGDDLMSPLLNGPFSHALDTKQYLARAWSRIAAYEKSAKTYLDIASRDRTLSKIGGHAMLRCDAERMRIVRKLEAQDVNVKRVMLTAVIEHSTLR